MSSSRLDDIHPVSYHYPMDSNGLSASAVFRDVASGRIKYVVDIEGGYYYRVAATEITKEEWENEQKNDGKSEEDISRAEELYKTALKVIREYVQRKDTKEAEGASASSADGREQPEKP